jgi:hypothetical protein
MARIIEGEIYKAHLLAKEILDAGAHQRELKMQEAQNLARQIEQEAVLEGTQAAYDEVVKESIVIFKERHRALLDSENELRSLSGEIAQKILGEAPKLVQERQQGFIATAVREIARKRRLCFQFPLGRISSLDLCRDAGIDFEEVCDVEPGQVRVVTDIGALLCSEQMVISSLPKEPK